jgi:hypothetical protein
LSPLLAANGLKAPRALADRAALKLRRHGPTVIRSSHSAVALEIDHDQSRPSTNAIAPRLIPEPHSSTSKMSGRLQVQFSRNSASWM